MFTNDSLAWHGLDTGHVSAAGGSGTDTTTRTYSLINTGLG